MKTILYGLFGKNFASYAKPLLISFSIYRVAISIWAFIILKVFPIQVGWLNPTFSFYLKTVSLINPYFANSWFQEYILWPWYRWDAEWYLRIAIDGYQPNGSVAFAPLYPFLVRTIGYVMGQHYLLAALIISSIAAFFSMTLLYSEASEIFPQEIAFRSALYFLSFPTAFFLVGAYSESLFVLFVLIAWRSAKKNFWPLTIMASIMAMFTRFQGIGIVIPLLIIWSKQSRKKYGQSVWLSPPVYSFSGLYTYSTFTH